MDSDSSGSPIGAAPGPGNGTPWRHVGLLFALGWMCCSGGCRCTTETMIDCKVVVRDTLRPMGRANGWATEPVGLGTAEVQTRAILDACDELSSADPAVSKVLARCLAAYTNRLQVHVFEQDEPPVTVCDAMTARADVRGLEARLARQKPSSKHRPEMERALLGTASSSPPYPR